ncbi:MAG TPA: uroporphyrinogen decarboxylase family protein [Atribacteraceae bacterium]|nr:uroporphyrinogen decarboxylase family protein [Atribacteraceae bacterium]
MMNSRERIICTIQREKPDRIPSDIWATPEVLAELKKYLKADSEQAIWSQLGIDKIVNLTPTPLGLPVTWCYAGPPLPPDTDIWGVRYLAKSYAEGRGVYWEMSFHPLATLDTVEAVEKHYRFPRVEDFDFSGLGEKCREYTEYAIECGYISPFYIYNNIRGLEQSLMDLAFQPEYAHFVIARICDFLYRFHERLFEMVGKDIDIAQVTDDFGMQSGLLISPDMFREYFRPHYQKFIQLLKDCDILVFHHDDGAMAPLLPDLVDLGIDVLNPVQWRLPGMDPATLKKRFGDQLTFHGGIDNQQILSFGSRYDVEREVRFLLEALAPDGTGYIVAPCHNIQPITSMENIVALYQAVHHYGVL